MTAAVIVRAVLRIVGWLFAATVAVNIVAVLSPWHLLVRTDLERYQSHEDMWSNPPRPPSLQAPYVEKTCVYWGGGVRLHPTWIKVEEECELFREKEGSSRLIDW